MSERAGAAAPAALPLTEAVAIARRVEDAVGQVVLGKPRQVRLALATWIAGGHLLIDDVPGTGKTLLAKALARAVAAEFRRLQCTPDLLPADVTGLSIYNQASGAFEFVPGPAFTHVLLADEINRATPRTQSSLLECMEEHQITVDGQTFRLPEPFFVIATQNPVELEGTFPLPEAELDRFSVCLRMGYLDEPDELAMLRDHRQPSPLDELRPVATADAMRQLHSTARKIHVQERVLRYLLAIVRATREHPRARLGASSRAGLALLAVARAFALLEGLEFVDPPLIRELAAPVLAHRILLDRRSSWNGRGEQEEAQALLDEVLAAAPTPERGIGT